MADIFKKYGHKFPPPPPPIGHHCRPNINININNDDNDNDGNAISPIIIDLINRINKVENKVDDFNEVSGLNIQLGEDKGQAYPGEKGKENSLDIRILKSNVESLEGNINLLSGELNDKVDYDEIPDPEIYYVNEFSGTPSISGIYINGQEAKFWNGSEWFNITLKTISNISDESSDEEIPTAKAVYDALQVEMDKYATDEEVTYIVSSQVNEIIDEKLGDIVISGIVTGNEDDFGSLLSSITNFNNNI